MTEVKKIGITKYNISEKQESIPGFVGVDSSMLQGLNEKLKTLDERCYKINRSIGSLETKMDGLEKWKWIIITAIASPVIISVFNSLIDLSRN